MLHAAHPTDLPGLLRFAAQAVPNLAYPLRRLGEERGTVWTPRALLAPLVPHRGAIHNLLLTQGRQGGGLASLRGYRHLATWEVDQLLLASDHEDTCIELLARLDAVLLQARGERAFVRLADGSPALDAAREAGYCPYLSERLYRLVRSPSEPQASTQPPDLDIRLRRPEDEYALFRLYNAATPISVRTAEGLTFREWQEANAVRWQGGAPGRDIVALREGIPVAWCRLAAGATRTVMSVLVRSESLDAAGPTAMAAVQIGAVGEAWVLVQDNGPALPAVLCDVGFVPGERYVSLVHQVGTRVVEPAFMPARV